MKHTVEKQPLKITLECPDNWGEGYAIERALMTLNERFETLYGFKWRGKR